MVIEMDFMSLVPGWSAILVPEYVRRWMCTAMILMCILMECFFFLSERLLKCYYYEKSEWNLHICHMARSKTVMDTHKNENGDQYRVCNH